MKLHASWIWLKREDYEAYNQTIIAVRDFRVGALQKATMAITADSFYRVYINDRWICDGPCRSWPEHYRYDVIDVTPYVQQGKNQIRVIAKYYGAGTFHQVPRHPGLLAQLEIINQDGTKQTIETDKQWKVAEAPAWFSNTPKISIQQEPYELYDARKEDTENYSQAKILFETYKGPWKDLQPRDCPPLTIKPFGLKRFKEANVVDPEWYSYIFPLARLCHPGLIEANGGTCVASAVATVIKSPRKRKIRITNWGFKISINGKENKTGIYDLSKGKNLMFCMVHPENYFGHAKEYPIRFVDTHGFSLENPLDPKHENPWCFIPIEESSYATDDMIFPWFHQNTERKKIEESAKNKLEAMFGQIEDLETYKKICGGISQCLPSDVMLVHSSHWQFTERRVIGDANQCIENSVALMQDTPEMTVVKPVRSGDIELVYDLGQQNIGYYDFEVIAEEGLVIDIYAIEHITENGRLQHTYGTHNGMRYVCKNGLNRFTSLKRRSGRFIYITLRNQTKPVSIRNFKLIESTYPVNYIGSFSCSDELLTRFWDMSALTLKLCMEDTYTDCPLYEQTHWVGDARNESLYGYSVFGASDLGKRCIRLTAQSLERYPIAGCQVPSSWDTLLPAWSFLWGISVWDYYFYSGDKKFIKDIWKWVKRNIRGAEQLVDKNGLFSGPFWNMFDWTNIDAQHYTVIHNSMLLVGAINAALCLAEVVPDKSGARWLITLRKRIVKQINSLWDDRKKAYPDSIHADGSISTSVSQHTSFMAVLYDIIEKKNIPAAVRNMLHPPKNMVTVGSPFAIQYLYEALEKVGIDDKIIELIRDNYTIMVKEGATTVWETFRPFDFLTVDFPTRSHCHAWSSAPAYFLNRIILGIKQRAAGGAAYEISPRLLDLDWAKGTVATARGPIEVRWERNGKNLYIWIHAPADVKISFAHNESHKGLNIILNGTKANKKIRVVPALKNS